MTTFNGGERLVTTVDQQAALSSLVGQTIVKFNAGIDDDQNDVYELVLSDGRSLIFSSDDEDAVIQIRQEQIQGEESNGDSN